MRRMIDNTYQPSGSDGGDSVGPSWVPGVEDMTARVRQDEFLLQNEKCLAKSLQSKERWLKWRR